MNSDQIKGATKEVAGKVQKGVGNLTDNPSQQVKGASKEIEGKTQKEYGNAKEKVKDVIDKL
jgi:uncharacterized protein YjbJ (UPF0337 family)